MELFFVTRTTTILMWLGLPLLLLFGAPIKFIAAIGIILVFSLYSHVCQAVIYRHLIHSQKNHGSILKVILFGALEINRLQKLEKTQALAD